MYNSKSADLGDKSVLQKVENYEGTLMSYILDLAGFDRGPLYLLKDCLYFKAI